MQMVVLQICTWSNGIKVRITKAYCKISVMAVFMRKNKPFVPHIGSLSLCCWIILGHIGRGGLESREDDISLSAWVSGLRGRFQKGRKCLCMYLSLLWNILANQDTVFMNAVDEWMLFLYSDGSYISYVKHTVNPYSTDWICCSFIVKETTCLLSTLNVYVVCMFCILANIQLSFPEIFFLWIWTNKRQEYFLKDCCHPQLKQLVDELID